MFKKIITFCMGLMCFASMQAQTESTISADDILYWVGQGDKQAILVVDFGDHAYAWGYRFEDADEADAYNMISAIDEADPRLAYSMDWGTYDFYFFYVDYPQKLMATEYRFKVNGVMADDDDAFSDYDLADGMVVKVSTSADDVWSTPITAATVAEMPVFSAIIHDNINFWVGSGENEATVIVYWSNPDTALAWGYRFDGEPTVSDLFAALSAADTRLTAGDNSINFVDGDVNLSFQNMENNYLQFDVEGTTWPGWNTELFDGAVVRVGESLFGTGYDSTYSYGSWYPAGVVWSTPVVGVNDPNAPEEATIDANDIVYWVGSGENQMVMAVNWADTALAWGCRFSTATITVADVMDSIANADARFSYTMNGTYLGDIRFAISSTDTLGVTPGNWWESRHNGVMDAGMIQTLENGDFEKWGDPAAGVVVDSMYYDGYGWSYIYVYPMTIYPVSQPTQGISTVERIDVRFYPNPASAQLHVSFTALANNSHAVLYDMTGREVYHRNLTAGESEFTLPVAQMANGIYMLRISGSTVKIAVKH